jgi:hypothetical protein
MAGTIVPMVHGKHTALKLFYTAAHGICYVAGASLVGFVVASAGLYFPARATNSGLLLLVACASYVLALRDCGLFSVWLPQFAKQVPRRWQRLPTLVALVLYGFGLGIGVFTRITASAYYVVLLWATFCGAPIWASFVVSGFGFGRATPISLLIWKDLPQADKFGLWLGDWVPIIHGVNVASLGCVGGILAGLIVSAHYS